MACATEPNFHTYTAKDGLPSNNIFSLGVSPNGKLFVGTSTGAVVFNGGRFEAVSMLGNNNSFAGGKIESIIPISNGDVWFGSGGDGISILKSNNELAYLPMKSSNNRIRGLFEDSKGNIWIGTDYGLNLYNPKTKTIKTFSVEGGLSHHWVRQIIEDSEGFIWVGTWGGGLNKIHPNTHEIKIYKHSRSNENTLSHDIIYSLFIDSQGTVWAGTYGTSINSYNQICDCFNRHPDNFEPVSNNNVNYVYSFYESSDGAMFATTGTGVYRVNSHNTSKELNLVAPFDTSISNRVVTSSAITPDGTLWLGTSSTGLVSIPPQGYSFVNQSRRSSNAKGVQGQGVLSVSYINSRYVISSSTGIAEYKLASDDSLNFIKTISDDIEGHTILKASDDSLWVASGRQGIHRKKNIDSGNFEELSFWLFNRDDESIFDIEVDDKHIWVTSWLSGVLAFNIKTEEKRMFKLPNNTQPKINAIKILNGDVWVGALDGLYRVNQQKGVLEQFLINVEDEHNHLNHIYDISGVGDDLWLATETGVFKFGIQTKEFTKVSPANTNKISQSIALGPDGYLWSTFGSGVIKINSVSSEFELFDGDYFTDRIAFMGNSILSQENGFMLIGGYDGLLSFNVNDIYQDNFKHEIFIENISSDEEMNRTANEIEFSGKVNNLKLTFSTNETRTPKSLSYQYRILETKKEWTQLSINSELYIPYLSYGEYTTQVRVVNGFGNASEPFELKIIIHPPLWLSKIAWWFYVVAIITTGILFYKLRIRHLKMRGNLLECKISERTNELSIQNKIIKRQAEELQLGASQKTQLYETISHELRTPITLIMGPAKQLTEQLSDKKLSATARLIERNATRLNRLVNQLLDLSRSESKIIKASGNSVDLCKVVRGLVESFKPYAFDAGVSLSVDCHGEIIVLIGRDDAEKMISNLLSNAVKYSRFGDTVLIIVSQKNNIATIKVVDTGIGMKNEHLDEIFTRFYRVNAEQTATVEGSGIGLSIVKSIVDGANGKINVNSKVSAGTTFTIELPLNESSKANPNLSFSEAENKEPDEDIEIANSADKPHLLLVDDNEDILSYVSSLLHSNYLITTAKDGESGIEKARGIIPDIIVSDIMMPGIGGLELLETLKSDELTNHIPIVMLTAKGGSKIDGLMLRADDYIAKPFDENELLLKLRNLLDARDIIKQKFVIEYINESNDESDILQLKSPFITKLETIIEQHYQNSSFSVAELAIEAAVGERQLLRKLKAESDMGAKEYIRTFRLKKAAKLMMSGNTASFTANEVGFSSQAYFSSCFKAFYNQTPSQFASNKRTA